MPKPIYVWSGTQWVSVATEVESLATYATQSYADSQPGMKMVVPTSVAVGSGSGSVDTNGAVTFTTASSISLNGCFTSTYQNYKILFTTTGISASNALRLRLRLSGTDASGGNYSRAGVANYSNAATLYGINVAGGTYLELMNTNSGAPGRNFVVFDLANPNIAQETTFTSITCLQDTSGFANLSYSGLHDLTTAYDGFSIFTSTGTMTGTIRVYGYKN